MYFIFYIFLLYIPLFNIIISFFICRLYIGSLLSLLFFILCVFLGSMIISGISPYEDFYFYVIDLYIIIGLSFYFLGVVWGYGYIILVIWGFLYHRTGIYLFDFFFVCVFWDPNVCDYIILIL